MEILITNKFRKQADKIDNKKLKITLYRLIQKFEHAKELTEISNLKKLKGHKNYYRVRLGDYRIGLVVQNNSVIFAAIDHRSDIYKYFP